jgi:hypothetical protein
MCCPGAVVASHYGKRPSAVLRSSFGALGRFAIACAAGVVLPIESVVLISINCWKMSCAVSRVTASLWGAAAAHAVGADEIQTAAMIEVSRARYFKKNLRKKTQNFRM